MSDRQRNVACSFGGQYALLALGTAFQQAGLRPWLHSANRRQSSARQCHL